MSNGPSMSAGSYLLVSVLLLLPLSRPHSHDGVLAWSLQTQKKAMALPRSPVQLTGCCVFHGSPLTDILCAEP